MRFKPIIFEKVKSKAFIGDARPHGRVTVEPLWNLRSTDPAYGSSERGPYRWFQDVDDSGVHWEVPNIKSISWDRSDSQDLATCDITLFNMWHESNGTTPELAGQVGAPGYFWPKRGLEINRWDQIEGTGSFRKDGFWDPYFSWSNVRVPYAKLQTWEGYGGHSTPSNFRSIDQCIDDDNLLLTGTWLIKSITAGSGGEMVLNCLDMGRLLLEQSCFPPTVPSAIYPLEYYPAGKTAFDSVWGPTPKAATSAGSQGEVRTVYANSSLDALFGWNTVVDGHTGVHSNDGNWQTFSISNATATPTENVWFEFDVNQEISKLSLKAWAGGYDCYISVTDSGDNWLGADDIPGTSFKYIHKANIPLNIPDNQEPVVNIEIPAGVLTDGKVNIRKLRLTFRNLYYYGGSDVNKYRAGIRDLIVYRQGEMVDPYEIDYGALPTTTSMAAHPTRGYWIVDLSGNVHGFGDAADYDSTAFGQIPIASAVDSLGNGPRTDWGGTINANKVFGLAGQVDGKGYWAVDKVGHVYAYGSAVHYGEFLVEFPPGDLQWGHDTVSCNGIARTCTGLGYWVIYTDGTIKGFGDAAGIGPAGDRVPTTPLSDFLTALNPRFDYQSRLQGITSHPHKLGFWGVSRAGEVFSYGDVENYGGLVNLVYNPGLANSWALPAVTVSTIEATASGNGYWIADFGGNIGGFGDAIGKGPVSIYGVAGTDEGLQVVYDDSLALDDDFSAFRSLIYDVARDPDGTGFWVLIADGSVAAYDAEFWGQPSYEGKSGYRWHDGNFNGEWSSILRELCLWAGFTFYDASIASDEPGLFGEIESTGIYTDTIVTADKFDKRPLLDIIKELCEVVAYKFSIREDGGVKITSPNMWRSGNWDEDGARIYVDSGTYDRIDENDVGAVEFVPIVDELVDMLGFSATLDSESMRSEIIIGTDMPSAKDPSLTNFIRFTPRSGTEEVAPGIQTLRNIPRVGLWISQIFTNPEEMALMAELISLYAWFSERTASTSCVANPCLQVGDQIKLYERYTSESFNHYISGINSSHDLQTGVWTYSLTTHWLGDKDHWVITANAALTGETDRFIEISERLDRWQQITGKNLEQGALANGENKDMILLFGEFGKTVYPIGGSDWVVEGTLSVEKEFDELRIDLKTLSAPLGSTVTLSIDLGASLVVSHTYTYVGETHTFTGIGNDGSSTTYTFTLTGTPSSTGSGNISISTPSGVAPASFSDSCLVVNTDTVLP